MVGSFEKIFYFTWFRIKFQQKSPNFKELAQKLQKVWTKTFEGYLKNPGLNRVNYCMKWKFPLPPGKVVWRISYPSAVQSGKPSNPILTGTLGGSFDSPIISNDQAIISLFVYTDNRFIVCNFDCQLLSLVKNLHIQFISAIQRPFSTYLKQHDKKNLFHKLLY